MPITPSNPQPAHFIETRTHYNHDSTAIKSASVDLDHLNHLNHLKKISIETSQNRLGITNFTKLYNFIKQNTNSFHDIPLNGHSVKQVDGNPRVEVSNPKWNFRNNTKTSEKNSQHHTANSFATANSYDTKELVKTLEDNQSSKESLIDQLCTAKIDASSKGASFEKNFLTALSQVQQSKGSEAFDQIITHLFDFDGSSTKLPDSLLKQRVLLFELHQYYKTNKSDFSKLTKSFKSAKGMRLGADKNTLYYKKSKANIMSSGYKYDINNGRISNGQWSPIKSLHHGKALDFSGEYSYGEFKNGILLNGYKITPNNERLYGSFDNGHLSNGVLEAPNGSVSTGKFKIDKDKYVLVEGKIEYKNGNTEEITPNCTTETKILRPTVKNTSKAKPPPPSSKQEIIKNLTAVLKDNPTAIYDHLLKLSNNSGFQDSELFSDLPKCVLNSLIQIKKTCDRKTISNAMDAVLDFNGKDDEDHPFSEENKFQRSMLGKLSKELITNKNDYKELEFPTSNNKKLEITNKAIMFTRYNKDNTALATICLSNGILKTGKWHKQNSEWNGKKYYSQEINIGEFHDESITKGKILFSDGTYHEGTFKNNNLYSGKIVSHDGSTIEGNFYEKSLLNVKKDYNLQYTVINDHDGYDLNLMLFCW